MLRSSSDAGSLPKGNAEMTEHSMKEKQGVGDGSHWVPPPLPRPHYQWHGAHEAPAQAQRWRNPFPFSFFFPSSQKRGAKKWNNNNKKNN